MLEIATHVDIDADAALVWDILTDFATCQRWNPPLRSVRGAAYRGDTILITREAQPQRQAQRVGQLGHGAPDRQACS